MVKYLAKFLYVLSGSRGHLVLLMLVFVLASMIEALGIGLIGPFLRVASKPELVLENQWFNWIYSKLPLQSVDQFVPVLGLAIGIIFVLKSALYFYSKTYIIRFSFEQKGKLCLRLLNAYLLVPYTFHLNHNTSTLIKNIIVETNKFCNHCLLQLLNIASNLTIIFVLIILLLKTSSLFFCLILVAFLPLVLIFYSFGKRFRLWGKQSSDSQKGIIRIINHSLGGIKETRVIGCESYFEEQMAQQVEILERSTTLFQSFQILPKIAIETFLVLAIIAFVSLSFLQPSEQEFTSVLGVFAIASIRFIPSVSNVIQGIGNLQNNAYALDMLYSDLKELEKVGVQKHLGASEAEWVKSSQKRQPTTFRDEIRLKQITYRYPLAKTAALEDVSLTLGKGQSVALIGKSGAGKTTLVDVILGLLEPESGDICVDGVSIYQDIRSWQNLVGYIPQSIFLIDDTVERNIAFGVPDDLIDSERLNQSIQAAQLQELIEQLPNGIKTWVGERGARLSGGQRQRIGIARALYHQREILVLDEATSALDNETENLVTEAIESLFGNKTVIIIAHRLSTVKKCDIIHLMAEGRVVKSGTYREVVCEEGEATLITQSELA